MNEQLRAARIRVTKRGPVGEIGPNEPRVLSAMRLALPSDMLAFAALADGREEA